MSIYFFLDATLAQQYGVTSQKNMYVQ